MMQYNHEPRSALWLLQGEAPAAMAMHKVADAGEGLEVSSTTIRLGADGDAHEDTSSDVSSAGIHCSLRLCLMCCIMIRHICCSRPKLCTTCVEFETMQAVCSVRAGVISHEPAG